MDGSTRPADICPAPSGNDSLLAGLSSKVGSTLPPPAPPTQRTENTVTGQATIDTSRQSIIPVSARAALAPAAPQRSSMGRTWIVVGAIVVTALLALAIAYLTRGSKASDAEAGVATTAGPLLASRRAADRTVAESMLALGGKVSGTSNGHTVPQILPKGKIPPEFLLVEVDLDGQSKVTNDSLRPLAAIPTLKRLFLERTPVTDAGLVHLRAARSLDALGLGSVAGITNAGLSNLSELKTLKALSLADTKITDAGLSHLKPLTELYYLNLAGAAVTDKGLEELTGLTALTDLDLSRTKVTDYGLGSLRNLKQLKTLGLKETAVGTQGLEWINRNLPGCQIKR